MRESTGFDDEMIHVVPGGRGRKQCEQVQGESKDEYAEAG